MLLVSHDRALLDAVGTSTVAFEDGRLKSYQGGWAEYARVRAERQEQPKREERQAAGAAPGDAERSVEELGQARCRPRARGRARRGALAEVEDELADPGMWSSPTRRERATRRHAEAKRAVEEAYAAWEQATAERAGAAGRAGRPGRGTDGA